jgi:hypothetical protein
MLPITNQTNPDKSIILRIFINLAFNLGLSSNQLLKKYIKAAITEYADIRIAENDDHIFHVHQIHQKKLDLLRYQIEAK